MKAIVYKCIGLHENYEHSVVLSSGGDVIRLECAPHEFGKFILGSTYLVTISELPKDHCHSREEVITSSYKGRCPSCQRLEKT